MLWVLDMAIVLLVLEPDMVLELVPTLQQQLVVDMVPEELLELGDMVPEEVLEPGVHPESEEHDRRSPQRLLNLTSCEIPSKMHQVMFLTHFGSQQMCFAKFFVVVVNFAAI
jgi:hypothetical protein